jgi:hypothetical protein
MSKEPLKIKAEDWIGYKDEPTPINRIISQEKIALIKSLPVGKKKLAKTEYEGISVTYSHNQGEEIGYNKKNKRIT